MKYTIDDLEKDISDIITELAEIRKNRGKRYGTEEDTLANVRQADPLESWRGAYVNACECIHRLKRYFLHHPEAIDNKDFENASKDLVNYALFILILRRQKCEKPQDTL